MTPKQKRFARAVIEGANPSGAYRSAYAAAGMSAKSVANEANKLMNDPEISRMVREGEQEAMAESVWCRARAISQLEQVNQRCFDALVSGEGGVLDRSALSGFLETSDRLNRLCFVDVETEDAKASFKADPERLKRVNDESCRVFESKLSTITGL
ncbi:terminase small subunit [Adlercreutzia sp. ZJ242]|uniref:terminase small subunit n=1 Tax=Adlercreutzia sp. ZJ242 TaxID=2709409 RepID=UPI0013EBECAC|nr:terminase small subunit [Adlercreutzia sp. ZJ242]